MAEARNDAYSTAFILEKKLERILILKQRKS